MPPYRRNIGMVFQNYALFPHMTVADNIGFALRQRGLDRATIRTRVAETLDLVRMGGYAARYPRQLSGGQQQRVAIARAVIFSPRVLLMDEPLSALDKKLREEMQYEIKGLHERLGITFVYVTHDQQEALVMSDRIVVMEGGRIAQVGTPAEIYDRPANRFVAAFIGESNFLDVTPAGATARRCCCTTARACCAPPATRRRTARASWCGRRRSRCTCSIRATTRRATCWPADGARCDLRRRDAPLSAADRAGHAGHRQAAAPLRRDRPRARRARAAVLGARRHAGDMTAGIAAPALHFSREAFHVPVARAPAADQRDAVSSRSRRR